MSCTSSAVLDSTYRSSTSGESVRHVPVRPAALAYSARKYQVFHNGSTACRTLSRMPASVTTRSAPRRIADDIRNQRIASEPSRSKTCPTSG